jgi:purine-cytosine permease-like protein
LNANNDEIKNKLEVRGTDFIPDGERNSKPANIFFAIVGSVFCYSVLIIGTLPVIFGLGWWDSFWSIIIGVFVGSVLVAPVALLGQKTGTNSIVGSGAHFGTRGRVIGSLLTIFVALGFYSLTILTGAQSIVYSGHRLFGLPEGNSWLLAGALIIIISTGIIATYGHSIVVIIEKIGVWVLGAILILSLFVFSPHFDASYQGGEYLLGEYWSTWLLSASIALSLPISIVPYINDYARYIPKKYSARSILFATGSGMFIGFSISLITGAYYMTLFNSMDTPFIQGIINLAPIAFVFPLVIVGVVGSLTQGSFALYGAGLGLETIGWGMNRIMTTTIINVVCLLLTLLAIYIYDITDLVNAFVTIIIVGISPWLSIILIGYYNAKGQYNELALHQSEGEYWYSKGYNIPAIISWVVALTIGLMFTNTTIFVGPFANVTNGVDVSFISSLIVSAILYAVLSKYFNPNLKKIKVAKGEGITKI